MASFGLKNCSRCGQVYTGISKLCAACKELQEKELHTIYMYLRQNPNVTSHKIAQDTKISEQIIIEFVKKGLIQAKNLAVKCQKCGHPISRGNFCSKCVTRMKSETDTVIQELEEYKAAISASYDLHSKD